MYVSKPAIKARKPIFTASFTIICIILFTNLKVMSTYGVNMLIYKNSMAQKAPFQKHVQLNFQTSMQFCHTP